MFDRVRLIVPSQAQWVGVVQGQRGVSVLRLTVNVKAAGVAKVDFRFRAIVMFKESRWRDISVAGETQKTPMVASRGGVRTAAQILVYYSNDTLDSTTRLSVHP